jgi:dipeptidyl aminopeptidase/acylaminoacyl peptidase
MLLFLAAFSTRSAELGIFEEQMDIGKPAQAGSTSFEPSSSSYLVNGGGANMWFTNDAFHFVWKRVSGDFALQAAVNWLVAGGDPHRKSCLMARESLDPDAAYIDVAVHGNGLVSLQFRETKGGTTHEIQARQPAASATPGQTTADSAAARAQTLLAAARVGLQRQGEVFFLSLPEAAGPAQPQGAFMRLHLPRELYVGLVVCAHNDRALEKARFTDVALQPKSHVAAVKPVQHCSLEIVPVTSGDRRVIFHTINLIEAPNWSKDGKELLFNSVGRIYRLPVTGGTPAPVPTGARIRCNNDHGLSPDGRQLAISDQSLTGKSLIYITPLLGGTPRQITTNGPSYWHGWSPDGSTLAFCGERNGEFDIYTIPATGGEEKRLTTAKGLDDGPDYTADGQFIYFNSERTGSMQIWRMHPDGSQQEQVTSDNFNNWFPHPSPDGKWLVFLSYDKEVSGHPANKPVRLRLMPLGGGPIRELARLFGGQGTINVPSWSPDSRELAFVSYELIAP